ncbi:hypothetical protein RND81_09G222100 [Saponaria officinalis]|uniref:MADS-box domain-containing protein n=1 Tax=Saponaria officinalis TaxID=3572 RepID=A0AAW1IQ80_SAPOF
MAKKNLKKITDKAKLIATFNRLKIEIIEELEAITIECGLEGFAIFQNPVIFEYEAWPSVEKARRLATPYLEEQNKNIIPNQPIVMGNMTNTKPKTKRRSLY